MKDDDKLTFVLGSIESKLDKIDSRLDKVDSRLNEIDKTIVKQEVNLSLHMKRSDELEKHVKLLEDQFKPVRKHVDNITFLVNTVKWVGLPVIISFIVYIGKSFFGDK